MINKLLFTVLLTLTAFVVGGIFLPASHQVERNISVNQPASVIFTLLNSYKSFNGWSPWALKDPDAQFVMSGPQSGVGAKLSWSGDPRLIGEGWQEIIASEPYERITMHLDFGEQGTAESYFTISDNGPGSMLTWGFKTDVTADKGILGSLMSKYFGLFLDRWVGADYEQGLARFKLFAETLPSADFARSAIEIVQAEAMDILYVSGSSSQEAGDVAVALAEAFSEITRFMAGNGTTLSGQPMAITRSWDEEGYRFEAALPVTQLPESTSGNVQTGRSPSGRAVRYTHVGSYDGLLQAYEELAAYMAANSLAEGGVSWEHYISDPGSTPEGEIITHIYFLLQDQG